MNPWVRSVLAVVGGFVAMAVIVMVSGVVATKAMKVEMGRPTPSYMTVNLLYSFGAAVAGGYIAALIAGRAPLAHGIALAVLLLVMSGVSAVQSKGWQPGWYLVTLAVVCPLFCVLGAWLKAGRG
jgi:hypothetical protein